MNKDLLKRYIDDQPTKIVTKLDFATGKLSYDKIIQCQKNTIIQVILFNKGIQFI